MMKFILLKLTPCLKKFILSLIILLIISLKGYSQNVGISPTGSIPANAAAGLDLNFTSQGLLVPRIALTGLSSYLPLAAHVAGMVVYNIATTGDVSPGFYANDGTKWYSIFLKANAAGDMQYWDGVSWIIIPVGLKGQSLQINSAGVPFWTSATTPTLNTKQLSSITTTSAIGGGIILNDGGSQVTAFGVCWATITKPTITDNFTNDGLGVGSYTSNMTGLTTATIYYVRAYATTSNGTTYGNELSFTTP